MALPGQKGTARDDRKHAECNAVIEVLAKHDPGEARGEDALEVEEQRCAGGRCIRQPGKKEQRTGHPSGEYGAAEPGHIPSGQRRFRPRGPETAHQQKRPSPIPDPR